MLLVFDIETTGNPSHRRWNTYNHFSDIEFYRTSRVVQLGCVLYNESGDLLDMKEWIIKPKNWFHMSPTAYKTHCISEDYAEANGFEFDNIAPAFQELLSKATTLVAHDAKLIKNVLAAECFVQGFPQMSEELLAKPIKCTMTMGANMTCILPYRYDSYRAPKLMELYENLFQAPYKHHAIYDALACGKCYFKMINRSRSDIM